MFFLILKLYLLKISITCQFLIESVKRALKIFKSSHNAKKTSIVNTGKKKGNKLTRYLDISLKKNDLSVHTQNFYKCLKNKFITTNSYSMNERKCLKELLKHTQIYYCHIVKCSRHRSFTKI